MPRRAVVVSFDHLHAGFLGCFGNDWIETPHLDRLAAEAVVFDQHFCDNLDPAAANHAWWTGQLQFPFDPERQREYPEFVDLLHACGAKTCLVIESDGRDDAAVAPAFGEVLTVHGRDGFDGEENETPFARVVTCCGDWLRESARDHTPSLLWIKSRGVPTPWVPPRAFAELYLDEFGLAEDASSAREPDEDAGTERSPSAAAAEESPAPEPDGALDWQYAAAMYAAYMTFVDRWLGQLLATIHETPGWEDSLLLVAAAAGQSLGEHGTVGDETLRLRSESVQTPLWIRVPGSDQRGTRRQDLVQVVDLAPTLIEWFCGPESLRNPAWPPGLTFAGRSLLPFVRNEPVAPRESLVLGNDRLEWGIRTQDFFYVEPGDRHPASEASPPRLFEKPADRWDQSDVLSQYPQISEELRTALHRRLQELTARSTGFSRSPPE